MADVVTVIIGGEPVTIPLVMNFETLERVWPAIKASSRATDSVEQAAASIAVISGAIIASRPDLSISEIKSRLRVNIMDGTDERPGIVRAADELLIASGLIKVGEDQPPEAPAAEMTT